MVFQRTGARNLICTSAFALLGACGGGGNGGSAGGNEGGSGSAPITVAANPGATFSPQAIAGTMLQGESNTIAVNASLVTPGEFTGTPYFYIVDSAALLQPASLGLTTYDAGKTWTVSVATSSTIPLGHYQGNFILQACRDSACASEFDGFPVKLPYDLTVIPASNQSSMSRWAGTADWTMAGGNAGHTSYVPVSIDPNAINVRWRWHGQAPTGFGAAPNTAQAPVTLNGTAYFLYSGEHPQTVFAMSEKDGSVVWSASANWASAGYPALSSTRLFFGIDPGNGASMAMWSTNATDGSKMAQTPYGMVNSGVVASVVQNNQVYTSDPNGINIFNATTGGLATTVQPQSFSQGTGGAPAFDASNGYFLTPGQLNAFNAQSGLPAFSIASAIPYISGGDFDVPILAPDGSLIAHDEVYNSSAVYQSDGISSYNPSTKSKSWTAGTLSLLRCLAAGNGALYSIEGNTLVQRNLADGTVKWQTPILTSPGNFNNPSFGKGGSYGGAWQLIVTDNLAFATMNVATYAIDLNSHQVVWSYDRGGSMSLSPNGILYVATGVDGGLTAFNLH